MLIRHSRRGRHSNGAHGLPSSPNESDDAKLLNQMQQHVLHYIKWFQSEIYDRPLVFVFLPEIERLLKMEVLEALDALPMKTQSLLSLAMKEAQNEPERGEWWKKYEACVRESDSSLFYPFFRDWLTYSPLPNGEYEPPSLEKPTGTPNSPGFYIVRWDWIANTVSGLELIGFDFNFRSWFIMFLNKRGEFVRSTASADSLDKWMKFYSPPDSPHPFDIKDYNVPSGGYKTFNEFFLRMVKPGKRPVEHADDNNYIVSPSDGGIFFLTKHANKTEDSIELPSKGNDRFRIDEAFPSWEKYIGGPVLDSILWFTDFHHFYSPVAGTVVSMTDYPGSYNVDFDEYDPNNPRARRPTSAESNKLGWYKNLSKHRRYVWIIRTENMGYVAMAAIGFYGVGSIVVNNQNDPDTWPKGVHPVVPGDRIEKGRYLGHFGYGGSSIVLAFQPEFKGVALNFDFSVKRGDDTVELQGPDEPVFAKAKQVVGKVSFK